MAKATQEEEGRQGPLGDHLDRQDRHREGHSRHAEEPASSRSGRSPRAISRRRRNGPRSSASRSPTAPMRNCSPTPRSRRSTTRCPTTCTCRCRCRRPRSRQARAVREADRAHRRRGREAGGGAPHGRADRRGLHGAPPSAMDAGRASWCGRASSATLRAVQVLFSYHQRRSRQCPQQGRYRRRRRSMTSAAIRSSPRAISSAPSRRAVVSLIDRDPEFHTDRTTSALVDFGEGRHLTFTVATQVVPYQRVNILGTKGRLEIEIPFNAPQGGAMSSISTTARTSAAPAPRPSSSPRPTSTSSRVRPSPAPSRARSRWSWRQDAILQMRVIDALFRSEKSGAWEKV